MEISTESQKNSQIKVTIKLTLEETHEFMEKAATQVSKMVKVPGFRDGTAPLDVLKKHVREGAIESHMMDIALPETYTKAVKQEKLEPISKPQVNIVSPNPLQYEATVAIYPEVKISGYDKIKIKSEEVKVEDKDVEAVIEDIVQKHSTYKKVDRPAQMGDRCEIDFEGFDDGGAPLDGAKSQHHPIVLGSNALVPGFEEQLVGLKKGDSKEFEVKFPKDYFHKPFQNKKVKFKVFVHEVEEVVKPELNEEFIEKVIGEKKSTEELKKTIRTNLEEEKKHGEKVRRENEFLDKIADMTKVDTPDILVEQEIDHMMQEFQNELSQQGITIEKYLEQTKKEMKDLREMRRKEAEKRLKLRFGLQQIFKQENIEASEDEVKKEIDHIIGLYPEDEKAKVEKEYKEGSYLRNRLVNKVLMDKLFDSYLSR